MHAAVSFALALHVGAAPTPTDAPAEHTPPVGHAAERDEAARAFADGERAWARGDHAEAARQFARAQELVPHPDTLYNLGLAQRRAGDPVAAWHTFTTLSQTATTKRQRREAESQRAGVRRQIAAIEVRADPSQRVCVDDVPLPAGERRMVKAGDHVVSIDGMDVPLSVEGGETRTLERVGRGSAAPHWRARDHALLGISIGTAATATGLAIGAGVADERGVSSGLAFGAAAAAGLATVGTAVLLATLHRPRGAAKRRASRPSVTPAATCGA
jgi:hypothetical protein